jgi:hypothetical protein
MAVSDTCDATVFEGTTDECAQESWVWNGIQCQRTTHCGCASGECDRLYSDYLSCEAAHMGCLPDGCLPQDAGSVANSCGAYLGHAFNGFECDPIFCACAGEDCEDVEPTLEACESRFDVCLQRVPECLGLLFTIADLGMQPQHPEFDFTVDGNRDLYDASSDTVSVFADWTSARWLGWGELPELPQVCQSGVDIAPCIAPRPLMLEVGADLVSVEISMPWQNIPLYLIDRVAEPTDVEVRIAPHPTGTLVLQIRDVATSNPVLMVVRTLPELVAQDGAWDFGPFTFSAGELQCRTTPDDCNLSFAARNLAVSTTERFEVDTLAEVVTEVDGTPYAVLHDYLYQRERMGPSDCPATEVPKKTFALVQLLPE